MRIFLEGQTITESEMCRYIPEVLKDYITKDKTIALVGYIKNYNGEICIVLPKVFSDEFASKYNDENNDPLKDIWLNEYAILIYRVLKKYDSSIKLKGYLSEKINKSKKIGTLDVILNLIEYYNKHSYLYVLKQKNSNSSNPMNTNWSNMINRGNGKICDGEIFFDTFRISKWRNSEEDFLLLLLNTEINNISQKYGLTKRSNKNILLPKEYQDFLKNPLKLLKKIKKNYYRDDFIKLYRVLYSYYSQCELQQGKNKIEYLVTSTFQLVFEDMVDDLLSSEEMVRTFKYNKDGKIIDHIYSFQDAFGGAEGIYIGDSKYYKDDSNIKGQRWKQYTYARNVMNHICVSSNAICLRLKKYIRDDKVYGYFPIPNFFISAFVNDDPIKTSTIDILKYNEEQNPYKTEVFKDRLFDRDTHHVLNFQINLIHLGHMYLEGWTDEQKNIIKEYIRDKWIRYLLGNYKFWVYDDTHDIEIIIKENYFNTFGRFVYDLNNRRYIFASKNGEENDINTLFSANGINGRSYTLS